MIQQLIESVNNILWTYVLTTMLCLCALWFTIKTRFCQIRMIGDYYYGEANIKYLTKSYFVLPIYRLLVGAMVLAGALMTLNLAWTLADVAMGMMTICNLIAIVRLGKEAFLLLDDYRRQREQGTNPTYHNGQVEGIEHQSECWE